MASILKKLLAVALLAGMVGVVAYAMVKPETTRQARDRPGSRGGGRPSAPVVPVLAVRAARTDIPVVLDGVGTVRPLNTVTVRPQVDGSILNIAFREGQNVEAGDLLAEIDPATYQAALDQVVARRAITQTQLLNARRDYTRMVKIPGVMAQKAMDTQQAQVDQLAAQLKADDAAIASARTVLNFTRITAPITGRTGLRLVDKGNLVRAGDAGLVTISQIDPVAVLFTLPQQQLQQVQQALAAGSVAVEALDADRRRVIATGTLDVIDNQIDQQTGTIRMKAVFANPKRDLWPGQFVNARVRVDTLKEALSVPVAAVQHGPAGTFVWLRSDDGKAVVRPIRLGMQTDKLAVITKGLDGGEEVVTSGFARISEGANLIVRPAPSLAPVSFAPPPRKQRGSKGRRRPTEKNGKPAEAAPSTPARAAAKGRPDAPGGASAATGRQ